METRRDGIYIYDEEKQMFVVNIATDKYNFHTRRDNDSTSGRTEYYFRFERNGEKYECNILADHQYHAAGIFAVVNPDICLNDTETSVYIWGYEKLDEE